MTHILKLMMTKTQLIIGFLFMMNTTSAQVDTAYWNNLDRQNYQILDLMNQDLDSALLGSNQLLASVVTPLDTMIYSRIVMYNCHALSDKGLFSRANNRYLEVMRLREKLADKSIVSSAYHCVANINYQTEDYSKTVEYALKAIKSYSLKPKYFREVANCYNLIGVTYYEKEEYDSALFYYDLGIKILDENAESDSSDYQFLFDNKGNTLIWS